MSLTSSAKAFGAGMAALFRRYAQWLVSITWKRFILLSIVLMIVAGVLSGIPPFSWDMATSTVRVPSKRNVDISVDEHGVRIKPKRKNSQAPEITIDEHGVRIKRAGDSASGKEPQEIIVDDHGVRMGGESPSAPATAPPGARTAPPRGTRGRRPPARPDPMAR